MLAVNHSSAVSFRRRRSDETPAQYFRRARAQLIEFRAKQYRDRRQRQRARLPSPSSSVSSHDSSLDSGEHDEPSTITNHTATITVDKSGPTDALAIRFPPSPDPVDAGSLPAPPALDHDEQRDRAVESMQLDTQQEQHISSAVCRKSNRVLTRTRPHTRAMAKWEQQILLELDARGLPQAQARQSTSGNRRTGPSRSTRATRARGTG